jgi:TIR domain
MEPENRKHLEALLSTYRRNLQILEQQLAASGGFDQAPLATINSYHEARRQVADLERRVAAEGGDPARVGPRYDVFLWHQERDRPAVADLARRLGAAGIFPWAGRRQAAHQPPATPVELALTQSEAVAIVVGPATAGLWDDTALRTALEPALRDRDDMRVIAVLLPGAALAGLPPALAQGSAVDFSAGLDDGNAFDRLVSAIRGEPPEEPDAATLPDEPTPYPGLLPFTRDQAGFFYGRTADRDSLLEKVRASPFVGVIGASGSGKSSLVMAGLLPALDSGWRVVTLTPGSRPLRALADQVGTILPLHERLRIVDDLEVRLAQRPDGLASCLSTLLADRVDLGTLLIVVDQIEELFTQVVGSPEEVRRQQRQFIVNLKDAARMLGSRVRVVMTLRADFVGHWLNVPDIPTEPEITQVLLRPMSEEALREVIVRPAQEVGALFEKGLVGRLIADMRDQPAALPLLQFTLAQLWQRRHGIWLTHSAYEAIGGVSGALDQRASAVYDHLDESQRRLARNLFVRLVAVSEEVTYTRRRVRRDELQLVGVRIEDVDQLLGILSRGDVRLIAAESDSVELAHEALIDHWSALRAWLDGDHTRLLAMRRLTETAAEWEKHGRDASYLYRGKRLDQARRMVESSPGEMNLLEQAFLDRSAVVVRRAHLLRMAAGAAGSVLVVMLLVALLAELPPFGPTWSWQTSTALAGMGVITLEWAGDGMMYAGLGKGAPPASRVARSADGGRSWTFLNLTGGFVSSLRVDPADARRVYTTLGKDGLYRSDDQGATWRRIDEQLPLRYVDALAVAPSSAVYAGDFTAPGVYQSVDHGLTWVQLQGSPQENVIFLAWANHCMNLAGECLLVGTRSGLWQWSPAGRWQALLTNGFIRTAWSGEGRLIAGGQGLFDLEGSVARPIADELIASVDLVDDSGMRLYVGGLKGNLWEWRPGYEQLHPLLDADLHGAATVYFLRGTTAPHHELWVGSAQGLHRGRLLRWFERLWGPADNL